MVFLLSAWYQNGGSRRFYRDVYQKDLPETKLIYFTLHALSATCCTFHLEMEDPIAAVRAVLAKQKYYLQSHMVMMEFQWMKSSGITWVELERQNGIAGGPDFTEGWEDIRVRGDVAADRYPEGIYLLAEAKRWDNWMRDEKVKNEAREGCGE
ncbi:hypothetical protein DPSP01_003204 [Paraphaeosphaeria sporulosa]